MMLPSTSSEDHEALNPVEFLELSVLKTIVMKLLLLKIGAISVMVPHNLLTTVSSESKTEKERRIRIYNIIHQWESIVCYLQYSHKYRIHDLQG